MRLLFVHQNFPGQYRHLAAHYARTGHQVIGIGEKANVLRQPQLPGVQRLGYELQESPLQVGEEEHRPRHVAGLA